MDQYVTEFTKTIPNFIFDNSVTNFEALNSWWISSAKVHVATADLQ